MNPPFVVNNKLENTFLKSIEKFSARSKSIKVGVAYTDEKGAEALCQILEKNLDHGCSLEILLGMSKTSNPPSALRRLLDLESYVNSGSAKKEKSRVRVCVSDFGTDFHPKIYLFKQSQSTKWTAIVGSANATNKGLNFESEIGLRTEGEESEKPVRELIGAFDEYFASSFPLRDAVDDLSKAYGIEHERQPHRSNLPWRNLLSRVRRRRRKTITPALEGEAWKIWVEGEIRDDVEKKLKKETGWDKSRYWYFQEDAERNYSKYHVGDLLIVIDTSNQGRWSIGAGVVTSKTMIDLDVKSESPYFVAYQKLRYNYKLNPSILYALRRAALYKRSKSELRSTRVFRLSDRQLDSIYAAYPFRYARREIL